MGYRLDYFYGSLAERVLETCSRHPNLLAYRFMGSKATFKALGEEIRRTAKALLGFGIKEGDIVVVAMPNTPKAVIFIYALNLIGAIANVVHPLSSEQEFATFANRVHAKTMLVLDQFYHHVEAIRKETVLEHVIVVSVRDDLNPIMKLGYDLTEGRKVKKIAYGNGVIRYRDFLSYGKAVKEIPAVNDPAEKVALLIHSGGTTGTVKAVELTNFALNAETTQLIPANPTIKTGGAFLSVLPIFHGFGFSVGIHTAFTIGVTAILMPRFTPDSFAKTMLKYRPEYLTGVPALYSHLVDVPCLEKANLSFLQAIICGGDYLAEDEERRLRDFFVGHGSPVILRQGYGMSECSAACTLNPQDKERYGSIGTPLIDVTVKIVEPGTDHELPLGEKGEIVFSTPTAMKGYYDNPEETAITLKVHSDGKTYVHSGDLGYIDEEGYVYFAGRIKRMIVTSGYNVYPMEIEDVLKETGLVASSCVVGIPHKIRGELVKAYVVLKNKVEDAERARKAIHEFLRKRIARYALPRIIEFIDALPMTKLNKVDALALVKMSLEKDAEKAC